MPHAVDITYPPELPVSARRADIAEAIRDHQVVIVAGETGSGKTTQLPKICLELGRGHARAGRPAADDRAHPAAADRGPVGVGADRRGARHRAGRPGRLPGAVHGPDVEGQPGQGDDRRHPARRAAARPDAQALRHDHHRRGARAEPQHRLPARLPPAAAAEAARPQADHHQRHHRSRALRRALLRQERQAGADRRGLRPHLPGRDPLPPAVELPEEDEEGEPIVRDQTEAIVDAIKELVGGRAGRRPRLPPRRARDPRHRRGAATARPTGHAASTYCRSTRGSPPPSSTGSSRRRAAPGGAWCWRPTSRRRR